MGVVFGTIPPNRDEQGSMRYACDACGTPLVLPASRIGASGPCPKCRTWIDGSKFVPREAPALPPLPQLPSVAKSPVRKRMQPVTGGRGRVQADGYLDHEYSERKELFATLRVLTVFLAVAAVILFITLYLREWMTK